MQKVCVIISCFLVACTPYVKLDYSPDGRFGSACFTREYCDVSIAQLVITPERYHGKRVQVYGELSVAFEVYGVRNGEHRVWVNLTEEQKKNYQVFNGKSGYVRGVYDATKFGHTHSWGGTITEVTRFGD